MDSRGILNGKEAGCNLVHHPRPQRALELVRTFLVDALLTLGRVQRVPVQGGPRVPSLDTEVWGWRKGSYYPVATHTATCPPAFEGRVNDGG